MLQLRTPRVSIAVLVGVCCIAAAGIESTAEGAEPAGGATVATETLTVYSRMSEESEVVKQLSKGDPVTVEFEMEKAEWAWCAVSEGGEVVGYVRCESLEREEKKKWESLGSSVVETDASVTKITVIANQVLVPVKLGYEGRVAEVLLLLDTGAMGTVINTEVAAKLAQLGYLKVGPHRIPDVIVGVIEHKGPEVMFDGLLGMDFLGSVRYEVDLKKQIIRWLL